MSIPLHFPLPPGRAFPDPPRCAFCDDLGTPMGPSPERDSGLRRLIAGPGLFICEHCVRLCDEILAEDGANSQ